MEEKNFLFIHIPKTSGTSFKASLLRRYADKHGRYYNFRGLRKLFIDSKKDLKVIGGHMPYGAHHFLNKQYHYITFLRDPIQRSISHYYFIKQPDTEVRLSKTGKIIPHNSFAKKFVLKYSLQEVWEKCNTHKYRFHVFSMIDNLQTRYLAGYFHYYKSMNSNSLLNKAIFNLKNNIKLFGINERYSDSVVLFEKLLKISSEKVDKLKNTVIEKKVTEDDIEVIKNYNKLDLELYRIACDIFNDRFESKRHF